MNDLFLKKGLRISAFAALCIGLPVQGFAALSTLSVINELHLAADHSGLGISATPVNVQVFSSSTKVCDSIASLVPGASFTTTSAKCATFDHFLVTPLSSLANGRSYPYGSSALSTDLTAVTTGAASYVVTDTGAGTAGTSGGLNGAGAPICTTPGSAAGSGDTSIPPALHAGTGIVTCQGAPTVTALPTVE